MKYYSYPELCAGNFSSPPQALCAYSPSCNFGGLHKYIRVRASSHLVSGCWGSSKPMGYISCHQSEGRGVFSRACCFGESWDHKYFPSLLHSFRRASSYGAKPMMVGVAQASLLLRRLLCHAVIKRSVAINIHLTNHLSSLHYMFGNRLYYFSVGQFPCCVVQRIPCVSSICSLSISNFAHICYSYEIAFTNAVSPCKFFSFI